MSVVTPGRIVIVRLAHGWRSPAVVITGCSDWQTGHPVTVHVFGVGAPDLEGVLPTLDEDKRDRIISDVLDRPAAVFKRAAGFVIENLPRAAPDDEHDLGWFFPPREVSP